MRIPINPILLVLILVLAVYDYTKVYFLSYVKDETAFWIGVPAFIPGISLNKLDVKAQCPFLHKILFTETLSN